jgi:type III secretory pathway component EscS
MKKIISLLFVFSLISICIGFYYKSFDEILGNKIIGFTMLFFVFIFMPIFVYNSWKGKKLSDYTFSNENIQKMKSKSSKSIK